MPVEIKELVIRTVVAEGAQGMPEDGLLPAHDAENTEELVQECVRQVLRILAKEKER